jgi:hypothetical protein
LKMENRAIFRGFQTVFETLGERTRGHMSLF